MAEQRYGIHFSLFGGVALLVSVLLSSFLIFVSGVYVGREVAASKAAQQVQAVRVPVSAPEEPSALRSTTTNSPLTWQLPKESLVGSSSLIVKAETTATGQKGKPGNTAPRLSSPVPASPATPPPINAPISGNRSPSSRPSGEAASAQPPTATIARTEKPEASSLQSSRSNADGQSSPDVKSTEAKGDIPASQKPAQKPVGRAKRWKVQVEATTQETTAQDIAKALREQGYDPSISKIVKQGEVWYRVRVGKFTSQEEADAAISRFRREGKFSQAYPVSE